MKRGMILLIALVVGAGSTRAQSEGWQVDKAHSEILFTVEHMAISEVTGEFKDYDVRFTAQREDFSDAAVQATINVNSIDTDHERRDGHLKSGDFFNAEQFPEMRFTSTSFRRTKAGQGKYEITGELTIRDVTRTVTFDATHRGTIKTQRGSVSAWKATLTINRFDFGLSWDKVIETGGLVVGEKVEITLNLELKKPLPS